MNQPLAEAGINALLAEHNAYKVQTGLHGRDAILRMVKEQRPHLLIVDYLDREAFSLEDLEQLLREVPELNVLVISSDSHRESILKSVQSGIKGYLTTHCSENEFQLAVESTAHGEKFFCSKILDVILEHRMPEQEPAVLTAREKEMLKYFAMGYSAQRIADELHLSPHTVQTHRKSVIKKLRIKSPTEFVIYALDMGLIPRK